MLSRAMPSSKASPQMQEQYRAVWLCDGARTELCSDAMAPSRVISITPCSCRVPLPSQQLLGCDPVAQVVLGSQRIAGSCLADSNVFQHTGSDLLSTFPRGWSLGAVHRLCVGFCR